MTRFELIDDGFTTLTVRKPTDGADTKPAEVVFDTFEVYNTLRGIALAEYDAADKGGRDATPAEKMRDHLNAAFALGCSAKFADDLYRWLKAEVLRVQKKDHSGSSAETPRPTDSPSGHTDQPDTPPA